MPEWIGFTSWALWTIAMVMIGTTVVVRRISIGGIIAGAAFALLSLLVYPTGMLPLWFYTAGLAFGAWGVVRFRPGAGRTLWSGDGYTLDSSRSRRA